MAKIGIIVPVYNVESYLRRCIESILSQTFQDFELLLLDDGSTDKSGKICDEYAGKSEKIKIIHKKNEGLSATRNRGIEENKCDYITFIDADDYIENQYLEKLWKILEEKNADLVISGDIVVTEEKKEKFQNGSLRGEKIESRVVSKEEAYRYMLGGKQALLFAWGKLYHKKLFQEVRYPEGEIFEDVKVIHLIIEKADVIVCTYYAGYFYVQRADSITHGTVSDKYMVLLENEQNFLNFIGKYYPDIEFLAKRKYFKSCFFLVERMASEARFRKECEQLKKKILQNWKFLIFGNNVPLMQKAGTICLLFGIPFYRRVWKFYEKFIYYYEANK